MFNRDEKAAATDRIDRWMTHPVWGDADFSLYHGLCLFPDLHGGRSPKRRISDGPGGAFRCCCRCSDFRGCGRWLNSLIVDGIIAGVGGILTFLPNIFILFPGAGVSGGQRLYGQSGLCHGWDHGKSGAVGKGISAHAAGIRLYACRPSWQPGRWRAEKDRLKTMLVTPFMSCSARLPIYVLFSDMFFGKHAALAALFHVCHRTGGSHSDCADRPQTGQRPVRRTHLLIELPEYKSAQCQNYRHLCVGEGEGLPDQSGNHDISRIHRDVVFAELWKHRHGYRCVPELRGCHRTLDGTYYGSGGTGTLAAGRGADLRYFGQGSGGVQLLRAVWHQQCKFGPGDADAGCQSGSHGIWRKKCVCHDAVLSAVHTLCGNHCNDPKGDLFHQMDGWRCDLSVGICLDRSHAVFPDQWTFYRITGIMSVEKRW